MGKLTGKIALVTGAASGIGRAITERFIADGARVIAGDIDPHGLESLKKEFGTAIVTQLCDVTQEDDVAQLCTFGKSAFGKIDIVVANAGAGTYGLITELPLSEWKRIIDLCLTGVFLTLKHGGAAISDGGSIINIASLNAIQPSRGMSAYCAAKAGLTGMTKAFAQEVASRGITANCVAPGFIRTAMTAALDEKQQAAINGRIPMGRMGEGAEIGAAVAFLASREAAYVTGETLHVNGGMAMLG